VRRRHTNDTWNPAEDREQDVDQEIRVAACLEEDGEGRQEDG